LGTNCSLFGLLFHSNLPLPGVAKAIPFPNSADVELHLGVSPYAQGKFLPDGVDLRYASPYSNEAGEPEMRVWHVGKGALLHVAYFDGTQFWIDDKRENVWVTWPEMSSLEEACTYLLGPILGLLLRLRGVTCLHASAVNFRERSVAFVGSAGAGKSTTAAAFAREGFAVLSDDIVPLVERDGSFLVMPAYPHLCLWPESVSMLYGSPDALPRFATNWEKRCLALGQGAMRFESSPLPLSAIYILGDRRADSGPCVEPVRPRPALLSLVAEAYANRILDREMRAREFEVLGRLVRTIPVRRLIPHSDPSKLRDLCRVIEEDFASLTA
jgi:hypothetical protein